jgi:hypothetical protein
MTLLADVNEAINKWLAENPVILGIAAIVIGFIPLALGISALATGRAAVKKGPDLEGGNAKAMGVVWIVVGAGCLLFGAYKLASGF